MTTDDRGRFAWYDLMTTDPEGATAFYTSLLGWGSQPWEGGSMPYTMWTNDGTPLGGLMPMPPELASAGVPPHWLAYVSVPDVDRAAARSAELGGTVHHPPTDIEGAGRFAVLADPHGASFAVYAHTNPLPTAASGPQVGQVSWHELASANHRAAFEFYADLFGWQRHEAMDMGPAGIYQLYGGPDMPYGGMFDKPAAMPFSCWLYYVRVADLDEAVAKVKALGGEVINGPMEVPGGDRIAQCTDPQGAMFAMHWSAPREC